MIPLNILIVEDDAEQAMSLGRILQQGLERVGKDGLLIDISIAGTLAEAIALAPNANVTLLDLGLPDSDPLSTIESIGKFRPPVIVMTANSDPELWAACLKRGADFVTLKGHIEIHALCAQVISGIIKDLASRLPQTHAGV